MCIGGYVASFHLKCIRIFMYLADLHAALSSHLCEPPIPSLYRALGQTIGSHLDRLTVHSSF